MLKNSIIGPPAEGYRFFKSEKTVQDFFDRIKSGSNLLISAPRRIGKTSLMLYFRDNPAENYECIYVITQSIDTSNGFFKKIFREIIKCRGGIEKLTAHIGEFVKGKKIKALGSDGITLEDINIDYYEEITNLILKIDLKENKFVVLVDEFADTVENIKEKEGESEAVKFLAKNRDLRTNPDIRKKLQFIYAGSVGLEGIVNRLKGAKTINDLFPFRVNPLTHKEAIDLINMLTEDANFDIHDVRDYMLNQIEWLIPFNIQLIVDEINQILSGEEEKEVKNEHIDLAFKNAIEKRNHFETWHTRLRTIFKGNEFKFVIELLNIISEKKQMDSADITNLSVKHKVTKIFKEIISTLAYDGYVNNNDDPKIYKFNSPILRMWWCKYVAN